MPSVLIADDSGTVRKSLVSQFQTEGYTTLEAEDGLETLEKIKNCTPDCVILDLLMPEMGGIEVLKILNKENIEIPVVVLSADIQNTTRETCLKLGAVDFIVKPLRDPMKIIEMVQKALCS